MTWSSGVKRGAIVSALLVVSIVGIGCRQKATVAPPPLELGTTVKETSPFDVAMEFLNNLDQYQPELVRMQILQNLREWSRLEEADVTWISDPMFRRLPKEVKEMFSAEGLATNVFQPHDALELQQAVWLRDVANAVARMPVYDPDVRDWLSQAEKDGVVSGDGMNDLSLAYRLFDWTIRNIELDPEFEDFDIMGGERELERRDRNTLRHQYYPWENLLYGHGDWLERSRVFMLLGRQFGINIVMLVADRGDEPQQPWANGVLIDDKLFLFDTRLGLPLPGEDDAQFSTLSDYTANPELLDQLNVSGERYRIVPSDLERLVACIDATPAALSQRMKQIESKLSGERKLALTVAPTPLAKKVRSNDVSKVEIWTFPYRGYQFFAKLQENPQAALPLLNALKYEQTPFENRGPLLRGRLLHLRGYYRGAHDNPGATKLYMDARMSKKDLQRFNIPISEVPAGSPLIASLPEDPIERDRVFRLRLQAGRQMAMDGKDRATYWLGLLSLDRQEFKVAADFLRLNVDDESSDWHQGARYNLARSLEALGVRDNDSELLEEAIELYGSVEDSPQYVGNLLRQRRLQAKLP